MVKIVKLIYTLDEKNKQKITLIEGTQEQIDIFTTNFENSKEIRTAFQKEIESLRLKYIEYINNQKREETGDIVIIDQNNKRIRVLYKRHIRVFNEIINDEKFIKYLEKKHIGLLEIIEQNEKYVSYSNNFIRKIYGIYKDEYKEKTRIKKEKQVIEEDFVGELIEEQYTKKLGGM